jgi:flagellar FliL protein
MRRIFLPLILGILGLLAGGGAAYVLRPPAGALHDEAVAAAACLPPALAAAEAAPHESDVETEFVKLNNQFVVPVVEGGEVAAMIILSISLEVPKGDGPRVYEYEPKLRDGLLQTLFNHANAGGFRGAFTETDAMKDLRASLLEAARRILGPTVQGILITDIVRQ